MAARRAAGLADPIDDARKERWQRNPMPLLEDGWRPGERRLPTETRHGCELVDEMRVKVPADGDDTVGAPGVLLVDPGDDVVEPGVDVAADLWWAAGGVPGSRQERDSAGLVLGLLGDICGEAELVERGSHYAGRSWEGRRKKVTHVRHAGSWAWARAWAEAPSSVLPRRPSIQRVSLATNGRAFSATTSAWRSGSWRISSGRSTATSSP